MKKVIVTTTINSPTEATLKFANIAREKEWHFIIVGDTKTPHDEYKALSKTNTWVYYLDPAYQTERYGELSDVIGWKTIQRRNIGLLDAYNYNADIIATVDDDNIPYENWGDDLLVGKEVDVEHYISGEPVGDPLAVANKYAYGEEVDNIRFWHRGVPLENVKRRNDVSLYGIETVKCMVQADLWDGDPDIDAICRLTMSPNIRYNKFKPFRMMSYAPFNSQNTFLHRDCIEHYAVLPGVGRMDDIWGGYLLQSYLKGNEAVVYNNASVYQDRNVQDLVTNLQNEILGYRHTTDFIEHVAIGAPLNDASFVPDVTKKFWDIWRSHFN